MATVERLIQDGFRKHRNGEFAAAETLYRRAIGQQPEHPQALLLLGSLLSQQAKYDDAIPLLEKSLLRDRTNADVHNNLGIAYQGLNRWQDAALCFQHALTLQPNSIPSLFNLGRCHVKQQQFPEALGVFQQVVTREPGHAEAFFNLGYALGEMGHTDEAISCYQRALQLQPQHSEALLNLAICQIAQNNVTDARITLDTLLALQPTHAEAHFNRAIIHLLEGNLAKGFAEYQWRLHCDHIRPAPSAQPAWSGESFADKTLLVYAEQGLGDTLQLLRYLPQVKAQGGQVLFECQPELMSLLKAIPGIDGVIERGTNLPAHDLQISLVSLPHVLGTTRETIPADSPYFSVETALTAHWAARIAALLEPYASFKIGIVWAGSPGHQNDRNRSAALATFAPLSEIPGVTLFSLQKGPATDQITQAPFPVIDLGAEISDFADTAAIIDNLDLVISVDTSVVHLAGAMGKPVWTLLPYAPDWRWMLDRDDSPWYPTMHLFRQTAPQDWDSVMNRVAVTLCNQVGVRCWEAGNVQGALAAFLQALQRDPDDRDTVLNCADVLGAFGQNDEAQAILSRYLVGHSEDEEIAERCHSFNRPPHQQAA